MAETLSQNEIDSLLSAISASMDGDYISRSVMLKKTVDVLISLKCMDCIYFVGCKRTRRNYGDIKDTYDIAICKKKREVQKEK